MTEISATARAGGVTVEVYPGGALAALTLSEQALRQGCGTLAATILDAVAEATALANQRTKLALGSALSGLGLDTDAARTEQIEATTPRTWRI